MSSSKRKVSDAIGEEDARERSAKRREVTQADTEHPIHKLSYPSTSAPARTVPFQQPAPLLTFSYTSVRELEFTDSALRYYVPPPNGAELRYGYERWVKRPEERGRLDGLLRAVSKMRERMDRSEAGSGRRWLDGVGVVAWRGVMTKILTAPYEERDGWEMNVMDVGGTLYLEEHLSDAKLKDKEDMTPHHRLQSYYGYSFEAWSTSSRPGVRERLDGHPEGWGGDVDTNVQWCCVVKTKLGDTRLVIGGEVDCTREKFTGKTNDLVELKTSMVIRGAQDEARFEKKLLKFYFQSFLLGVPEIVVGFRTPAGQLSTLQSFKTMQIPRLVRGKRGAWDPMVCFDWGHQFLAFLKSVVRGVDADVRAAPHEKEEKHGTGDSRAEVDEQPEGVADRPRVWRVRFQPKVGISVTLLDDAGVREVEAGEDRVGFLPKWYCDELMDKSIGERHTESHAAASNIVNGEAGVSRDNAEHSDRQETEVRTVHPATTPAIPPGWVT
ncbi:RAI1 like PD-XK nuclease-domain-containing protein [Fomitopsis serialis]|uniref:RAI1 like PD-XK nuclease-domain-containing protein n=1 Tax=Fomitopsis serialis TaxID=139415 RepID=UPI002007A870|nr:RAI1 like PD-XK nuclease-domain-containing protein [Neoantrodia serialis]KAH9915689.1 RAI1 like PD-XK nuclease-domain-containing protein [Neoantrodia serialis]